MRHSEHCGIAAIRLCAGADQASLRRPMAMAGGYVNGKWQSVNAEDYRPQICFEIIADEYFQIKYLNLKDH